MQMQPSPLIIHTPSSPSFNSYSSGKLAEIAARVVQEFSQDSIDDSPCNLIWETDQHFPIKEAEIRDAIKEEEEVEEEEFEFAFVSEEPEKPPSTADEIFYNGHIKPIYPLFDTSLLLDCEELSKSTSPVSGNQITTKKTGRLPLGKLFSEDKDTTSCSSSEADDLENVSADSYCVWRPKKEAINAGQRCKKSSSTGNSSKRWKFRDLLYRSNSDGKETFVFLAKKSDERKENKEKDKSEKGMVEKHQVKSKAAPEGDTRRSFSPCKQEVVGIFLN